VRPSASLTAGNGKLVCLTTKRLLHGVAPRLTEPGAAGNEGGSLGVLLRVSEFGCPLASVGGLGCHFYRKGRALFVLSKSDFPSSPSVPYIRVYGNSALKGGRFPG